MQSNAAMADQNDGAEEIETRTLSVPDEARAIAIIDNESFEKAGRVLLLIKDLRKEIDATFDPIVKKAHEAHKEAKAQKTKVEAPLIEAEGIIKPKMAQFQVEQERLRRQEQERLNEEARKKAEDDQLDDAISAEKSGMNDLAQSILSTPAYVPPVVAQRTAPKIAGIAFKDNWSAEVFDLKALLKAVLDGRVPANVIQADMSVLNSLAKSLKQNLNYPGVRAKNEKSVAAGRR